MIQKEECSDKYLITEAHSTLLQYVLNFCTFVNFRSPSWHGKKIDRQCMRERDVSVCKCEKGLSTLATLPLDIDHEVIADHLMMLFSIVNKT